MYFLRGCQPLIRPKTCLHNNFITCFIFFRVIALNSSFIKLKEVFITEHSLFGKQLTTCIFLNFLLRNEFKYSYLEFFSDMILFILLVLL